MEIQGSVLAQTIESSVEEPGIRLSLLRMSQTDVHC